MARPPRAREAILDAYESILIDEGERTATLDAVARLADVSKGGLLYHFASKDALVHGAIERLDQLVDDDVAAIEAAGDDAVEYYIRTSVALQSPLDRAFVATARLAQGGDAAAQEALQRCRDRWREAIARSVADSGAVLAIALLGDGMYFNTSLHVQGEHGGVTLSPAEVDSLVRIARGIAATGNA
ncbi:TetR/AcrR family transcriptional regulator [Agromyces atrinae]|uniref:TetR/AcrR family transcriptional regulator n=1 Tax=Agromyces atrinae TaxID=592376 RepID=UPI002412EB0B|nr:TetR/AcrR family transcriptional regulator [Agromyces atrinae]